ncbi:MAG: hypothetical protein IT244_04730 [Bacteroidia bacterium]|nr:hypothetical protein [Bacteroidia bacterium]
MNLKPLFYALVITAIVGYFSACATVINGTQQRIYLVSDKPGAVVKVNGETVDSTPCVIHVQRTKQNPPDIEISKDSFFTQSIVLQRKMNELSFLNFINIFGWGIDIGTGSIWRYNQPDTMLLEPKRKRP